MCLLRTSCFDETKVELAKEFKDGVFSGEQLNFKSLIVGLT